MESLVLAQIIKNTNPRSNASKYRIELSSHREVLAADLVIKSNGGGHKLLEYPPKDRSSESIAGQVLGFGVRSNAEDWINNRLNPMVEKLKQASSRPSRTMYHPHPTEVSTYAQ